MNPQIEKLYQIASKKNRRILGLMSGTSLDGLDIALCNIEHSGFETELKVEYFTTIPYTTLFREQLSSFIHSENTNLQQVCIMDELISSTFAKLIKNALAEWKVKADHIDLIASHGQTVYHAPARHHKIAGVGNATLQIGDGDKIAVETGVITISDFRQKHIAAGGEGAPLAPYGDYLLFSEPDEDVILLNIGGIANFTYLPAGRDPEKIICSDTGPGNTMMDAVMRKYFNKVNFDDEGKMAAQGKVNQKLLDELMDNDFFKMSLPKTTGTELFNILYVENAIQILGLHSLSRVDIMATLNYLTSLTITDCIRKLLQPEREIKFYISGGGARNNIMIQTIKKLLKNYSISFHSTNEKNIDPDAKEAVLFALLANECIAGNTLLFRKGSNNLPAVSMGKISLPK